MLVIVVTHSVLKVTLSNIGKKKKNGQKFLVTLRWSEASIHTLWGVCALCGCWWVECVCVFSVGWMCVPWDRNSKTENVDRAARRRGDETSLNPLFVCRSLSRLSVRAGTKANSSCTAFSVGLRGADQWQTNKQAATVSLSLWDAALAVSMARGPSQTNSVGQRAVINLARTVVNCGNRWGNWTPPRLRNKHMYVRPVTNQCCFPGGGRWKTKPSFWCPSLDSLCPQQSRKRQTRVTRRHSHKTNHSGSHPPTFRGLT